ncbi:MAG TPA: FAD-dependent thymidylate synthase [Thermoplasmata archaeon]|nr:FAD-dependent thymidylate synthase [Thermoplasmata archaeon]
MIRHRTACLAAGTPLAVETGGRRPGRRDLSIEELWSTFHPAPRRGRAAASRPGAPRRRPSEVRLRHLDEGRFRIDHARVVDVFRNGVRPVFRTVLSDGRAIDSTADHRFRFSDGWKTLREATGLSESDGRAVWTSADRYLYVNGDEETRPSLYRDPEWLRTQLRARGIPLEDVAEVCAIRPETVRRWAARFAIAAGPGHVPAAPRETIAAWVERRAHAVHERDRWACRACGRRGPPLRVHHLEPLWVDPGRARDPSNVATLCSDCHRAALERELAGSVDPSPPGSTARAVGREAGTPSRRLTVPRLVRIERFEYLGPQMTYDLEMEGPHHNFVAGGIVTHNSVNEYSARYSIIPDEFDLPPAEDVRRQSTRNRQGRGDALPAEVTGEFRSDLERICHEAYRSYTKALEAGVARETARLVLPLAYYTEWYWKINLHNLLHFLSLRLDPHSQEEIRRYAAEMAKIARTVAPTAYEAFEEFTLEGLSLGRRERTAVRALLEGASPEAACERAGLPLRRDDGRPMTTGEGVEFLEKLERIRTGAPPE